MVYIPAPRRNELCARNIFGTQFKATIYNPPSSATSVLLLFSPDLVNEEEPIGFFFKRMIIGREDILWNN